MCSSPPRHAQECGPVLCAERPHSSDARRGLRRWCRSRAGHVTRNPLDSPARRGRVEAALQMPIIHDEPRPKRRRVLDQASSRGERQPSPNTPAPISTKRQRTVPCQPGSTRSASGKSKVAKFSLTIVHLPAKSQTIRGIRHHGVHFNSALDLSNEVGPPQEGEIVSGV